MFQRKLQRARLTLHNAHAKLKDFYYLGTSTIYVHNPFIAISWKLSLLQSSENHKYVYPVSQFCMHLCLNEVYIIIPSSVFLQSVVFLAMIISRSLEYSMTYSTVQYSIVQYSRVQCTVEQRLY